MISTEFKIEVKVREGSHQPCYLKVITPHCYLLRVCPLSSTPIAAPALRWVGLGLRHGGVFAVTEINTSPKGPVHTCCVTDHHKTQQLQAANIYYLPVSMGQESGRDSSGCLCLKAPHKASINVLEVSAEGEVEKELLPSTLMQLLAGFGCSLLELSGWTETLCSSLTTGWRPPPDTCHMGLSTVQFTAWQLALAKRVREHT